MNPASFRKGPGVKGEKDTGRLAGNALSLKKPKAKIDSGK